MGRGDDGGHGLSWLQRRGLCGLLYFTLLRCVTLRYVMWFCDDMMPSLAGWLAGSFATSVGGSNTYAQAQARRTAAVGC